MDPMEVMISESQERMLAIVTPENLDEVLALCERWEIRASVVGPGDDHRPLPGLRRFTPGGPPRPPGSTAAGDELWPTSPARASATGPSTTGRLARPANQDALVAADPRPALAERFPAGTDLGPELLGMLALPNIADSSWVWRQYDHQLFLNTVTGPGRDAAVLRLKEHGEGPGPHHRREGPVLPPRPPDRRAPWLCWRRPATWPAPGPGRWPWSTA